MVRVLPLLVSLCLLLLPATALAQRSLGQTLYVPCYSHIYHGPKNRSLDLTVTLSVRNIDPKLPLTLTAVDYYDTEGSLIRHELSKPQILAPLMTLEFMVHQRDSKGGSGANFLVRWEAAKPVNAPLVEAVMISTESGLGVSFTSGARVLED
ncbi:MAG: DUF3124 domain-containing protein [Pseudodesulfovibrio sp.]|uniref:DUF3124 domain-containing protein n=1 Tax=Pseudodesulfovibrio aespoeensis (strain ATCC 700646 / DSM 10631 / Aspo-2) TaxID=643562 RepID=E6VRU4_PSEA9|nr:MULTISPECIES: DUF3124 domain-containing protein [Pseudodesulfovibrio]MBU4191771.1 DUF3124 domain-containing protein [Pseudomonadota bacterium]ADU64231.1 Protein of unknown function DUF3124 [Pseudodesulfovibrio aespoeensis Aspo-2]MBU4243025.1 DUF3124 domain-containing protein [Pseudomonadota bacterium]MBU4380280.1 DUF3124 domain-containing protein [Pseudomonadota bacterium]MBU4474852.1 DUF3124 domain-containing protein [Pseudomonadota bacterium]